MKCLVTGGAGFIGSHLCELLLENGHEVIALDNLQVGRLRNLDLIQSNPNFRFLECDVSELDQIEDSFVGVEWVFHLAGLADIVPSIENPEAYFQANVRGTMNVAMASSQQKVKRLIYAASSSCYGIPESYPTSESSRNNPQYPYALTKMMGEEILLHWSQVYQLPVVSLRLFNVYGPRSRTSGTYGAVFGVFLAQRLAGLPYTVVGNGEQSRDFTFVTDVARAFLKAAESSLSGEILNVGSGHSYTINELVELLGGPVTHIPKRPGEPDRTFADISKICHLLNWEPKVPLEEGVKVMLECIEDWKDAPVWNAETIADATKSWFDFLSGPSKERNES